MAATQQLVAVLDEVASRDAALLDTCAAEVLGAGAGAGGAFQACSGRGACQLSPQAAVSCAASVPAAVARVAAASLLGQASVVAEEVAALKTAGCVFQCACKAGRFGSACGADAAAWGAFTAARSALSSVLAESAASVPSSDDSSLIAAATAVRDALSGDLSGTSTAELSSTLESLLGVAAGSAGSASGAIAPISEELARALATAGSNALSATLDAALQPGGATAQAQSLAFRAASVIEAAAVLGFAARGATYSDDFVLVKPVGASGASDGGLEGAGASALVDEAATNGDLVVSTTWKSASKSPFGIAAARAAQEGPQPANASARTVPAFPAIVGDIVELSVVSARQGSTSASSGCRAARRRLATEPAPAGVHHVGVDCLAEPLQMSVPLPAGATAADFVPIFWDPALEAWSSKGLVVADVSAGRATVLTTHLTAFGATAQSILAEARPLPGAADAGKLLNYSRPENAFALSVVCVLMGCFVVAWVVAVRHEMNPAEASKVTNARAAMLVIWGSTVVSTADRVAQKRTLRRMQKRLANPDAVTRPDPEPTRKAGRCGCCEARDEAATQGGRGEDKRSSATWTSVAPQPEAKAAPAAPAATADEAAPLRAAATGGTASAPSKPQRPGRRANPNAGSFEGRTAAFVCNVYLEQLRSNHPFAFCFAPVESLAVFTRAQRVAVLAATWLASMAVAAVFFGKQPELITVRMGVAALSAAVMLPATVFFPMAFRWTTVVRSQLQRGSGAPALKAWHDTLDQAKKSKEEQAAQPQPQSQPQPPAAARTSVAKVAPAPPSKPASTLASSSSHEASALLTATGIRTISFGSSHSPRHVGESTSIEPRLTVPSSSRLASAAFSSPAVDSPTDQQSAQLSAHALDSAMASVTHLSCQSRGLAAELQQDASACRAPRHGDSGGSSARQGARAASTPLAISASHAASVAGRSAGTWRGAGGASSCSAAHSMAMVLEEGDTPNPADVSELSEMADATAMLSAGSSDRHMERVDSTRGQVNETEGLWNRSLVAGRGSALVVDEREADRLQAALPEARSFAADAFDGDAGRHSSLPVSRASGEGGAALEGGGAGTEADAVAVAEAEARRERAALRRAVRVTSAVLGLEGGAPASRASRSAWVADSEDLLAPLPPAPIPVTNRVLLARRHAKEVLHKSPFEHGPPDGWTSCLRVATLFVGWCGAALCAAAGLLGVAADAVPADLSFATPTVVASLGVLLLVAAIASSAANAAASKAATAAADVGHTVFLRRAAHAAASLRQVAQARRSIAAGATLEQASEAARAAAADEDELGSDEDGAESAAGSAAESERSEAGAGPRQRRVSESRRQREGVVSIDALEEAAATAKEAAYVRAGFCGCLGGRWLVAALGVLVAAMVAQAVAAAVLIFVVKVPLAFEGSLLIAGLEAAVVAVVAVAVLAIRWGARRASDIARKGEEDRQRVAERLEAEAEEAIRLAGEVTPVASPSAGSASSGGGRGAAGSAAARERASAGHDPRSASQLRETGSASLAPSAKERLSMNRAALKIQATWRGMTARRLILRTKELRTWAGMSAERLVLSCLVYMSLMLVVLASTYICLVFGVVFAPEQARSWLLSSLAGFAMDVLLQKPAVIFLTTMAVLALRACKRDHVLCYNLSPTLVNWRVV
ncbi:hypothetical protein FNF27_03503 [Cafeteria roenbergensis]|uniref:Uncharacterized protein n=1 Tax=Cafeteria roenbergensis TaxID=33653 RepID=A0A5A8EGM2_CAFRO|nr:hypothetical protein FNF27_03503 [Cafeteria roenbergensis]